MDLVAIISVIASATVGLSAAGVSLYGIHRTARTARATQVRQRKADAYLEVLRLMEVMEGQAQWVTTETSNLESNSDKEYYRIFEGQYDRELPDPPALGSQAVMRAHVAAFGSTEAKARLKAWLAAMAPIDDFFADLPFIIIESNNGLSPNSEQLKPLLDALPPEERARAAFAEAVANDLEHE